MSKKRVPTDKKLYEKVKREAKRKFDVWPSAYASGWLVKEYKRRGGRYSGGSKRGSPLKRWYDEKWIDVCKLPKKVSCGRKSAGNRKKYPYCRPSKRINSKTPKTSRELSKTTLRRLCKNKRKSPRKRSPSQSR